MINLLPDLLSPALLTVWQTSESDNSWLLLLMGPAGAVGVYWSIYLYYRNTNKSHSFETETHIDAEPVTGSDRKVDTVTGTRNAKIKGDNRKDHRTRVRRLG